MGLSYPTFHPPVSAIDWFRGSIGARLRFSRAYMVSIDDYYCLLSWHLLHTDGSEASHLYGALASDDESEVRL